MNKKKAIPVIIVVIVAIALSIFFLRKKEFYYAGTIEATEVDLPSRVASVIQSYELKEGATAKQGAVLVRLSCEDLKLAADMAEKDFSRTARLYKAGSVSEENYEKLRNRRDDAALRTSWCTIKAPTDGTLLTTHHEAGEWVNPGAKLLTLADLSEVYATVYVPQTLLARLSLNMPVKAFLPELDMKAFDGQITHIREKAEFTPKNVQTREERTRLVYGVKVTFKNPAGTLKPGMSVEVQLPEEDE